MLAPRSISGFIFGLGSATRCNQHRRKARPPKHRVSGPFLPRIGQLRARNSAQSVCTQWLSTPATRQSGATSRCPACAWLDILGQSCLPDRVLSVLSCVLTSMDAKAPRGIIVSVQRRPCPHNHSEQCGRAHCTVCWPNMVPNKRALEAKLGCFPSLIKCGAPRFADTM
jgi:hypothetical protein